MPSTKKSSVKRKQQFIDRLPALLEGAIAGDNDFILTFETDPDTGVRKVYALTGKFVSACMLRKLIGQAESQRDEGSMMVSMRWSREKLPH